MPKHLELGINEIGTRLVETTRIILRPLWIIGTEVTQAIQYHRAHEHLTDAADRQPDNAARLVAGKPAWARVYVRTLNFSDLSGVSGTLEVQRRHSGFLWSTVATLTPQAPGSVTAQGTPSYATERGGIGLTLNFIIPASTMCGTLRLIARVAAGNFSDDATTIVDVTLQQTLRLAGVMIAYNGPASNAPNAPNLTIAAPTVAQLQTMAARTLTILPVRSAASFRAGGTTTWNQHLQDPLGAINCTPNWDALHAAIMNARTADGNQAGWIYYGLLPNGVPMGPVVGCGGQGVSVGLVGDAVTMAHEIGHSCDLGHAPCGGAGRPDASFPAYEPYDPVNTPAGSIGEYGLDINNGNIKSPATFKDFMSYCGPSWISPYHHGRLINHARLNPTIVCVDHHWWRDVVWEEQRIPGFPLPDPPPFELELPVNPPASPPIDLISIILDVRRGGVVEVRHLARTRARPETEGAVATDLVARLRGERGEILAEATVMRLTTQPCGRCACKSGEEPPASYLAQAFIPDVAPGVAIEIVDGDKVLWERSAPASPITIGRFDARLGDRATLDARWEVGGEAVEVWLRWSRDGETWQALATGLTGEATVETGDFLPAGKVLIQLVAHDGFFSAVSEAIALEVPGRPASLAILHPREGFTYQVGQTLRLWGSSASPVERPVDPGWYAWKLDGREIGTGDDLWITAPKAGEHVLTLTLMEPDQGAVSHEVRFTTIAPPRPPRRRAR